MFRNDRLYWIQKGNSPCDNLERDSLVQEPESATVHETFSCSSFILSENDLFPTENISENHILEFFENVSGPNNASNRH